MDKTIVVMAAGLGSRYGGVKQIERLGPDGEILMEYAIYDAVNAGFNKIVLILKPEIYADVKELFGDRIEKSTGIKIDYAFQTMDRFTESRPEFKDRAKPFGTVHAVICAKDFIKTPFAVMNADDYYGAEAFRVMSGQLEKLHSAQGAAMVAYRLKNTVSPFGTVTRGVCMVDNGLLTGVRETYKIKVMPDGSIRVLTRGGSDVTLTARDIYDPESGSNRLGIYISPERLRYGLLEAATNSVRYTCYIVKEMFKVLGGLFTGSVTSDDVAGPVGTISIIGQAVRAGFEVVLRLGVLISINLGIMNILPIPALDGGRFLFMVIEAVRGKPIPPEKEGMIHMAGLVLLFSLMILLTVMDVRKLF